MSLKIKFLAVAVLIVVILVAVTVSFLYLRESNPLEKEAVPFNESPVATDHNSDKIKLLEMTKKIAADEKFSQKERESARLFYAKNLSDATPVGLSEERYKNFKASYLDLYDLYKGGSSQEIKARALLSFGYLYTESCSTDAWLQESFEIIEPAKFLELEQKSKGNKEALSSLILLDLYTKASELQQDKSIVINLAEERISSSARLDRKNYPTVVKESLLLVQGVKDATSTLETSPFHQMALDRKMFSMYLTALRQGIEIKDFNPDIEFERQLSNTLAARPLVREGSYTNENNLRYTYAGYLWSQGKTKNMKRIKEVLTPSFDIENEKNAVGWMYGLSVSENRNLYPYLKELSKEFPELKEFLLRRGWKNI